MRVLHFKFGIHKMLRPTARRWLSLKSCVYRTLKQYKAFKEYFCLEIFENPTNGIEQIFNNLNSDITEIYLEFMSYMTHSILKL